MVNPDRVTKTGMNRAMDSRHKARPGSWKQGQQSVLFVCSPRPESSRRALHLRREMQMASLPKAW